MATITTVSHGSYPQTPRRTYLTSAIYNTYFFQILKTTDTTTLVDTYSLVAVTGATTLNCAKGAYLRETGKKIYPGQYNGINTYLVSVFDDSSFLNGFINPNASIFLPLNTDKPLNIVSDDLATDPTDSTNNQGPPVYTHGDVLADGNVDVGGTITAGGAIVASTGQIRAATLTRLGVVTGGTLSVDSSLGQMFLITITGSSGAGGVTINMPQVGDGSLVRLVISNHTASTAGNCVVTFGSSVHSTGTLTTTTTAMYCVTFFHIGNDNVIEVSRTGALSSPF